MNTTLYISRLSSVANELEDLTREMTLLLDMENPQITEAMISIQDAVNDLHSARIGLERIEENV